MIVGNPPPSQVALDYEEAFHSIQTGAFAEKKRGKNSRLVFISCMDPIVYVRH